jgi:hypothetical protein
MPSSIESIWPPASGLIESSPRALAFGPAKHMGRPNWPRDKPEEKSPQAISERAKDRFPGRIALPPFFFPFSFFSLSRWSY